MARGTSKLKPLDTAENAFWRAFVRSLVVVPRVLNAELEEAEHLSLNDYSVLVLLSESEGRRTQLGDLAARTSLTISGITRVVDRLVGEGLVERVRGSDDARIYFAVLTNPGYERLKRAYPVHLAGVRRHVIDRLSDLELEKIAQAFATFAQE